MAEPASNYIFGDPAQDRLRLETQTSVVKQYVRRHAREFCGEQLGSILDVGCGEGQLGFALLETYPTACLVGIDRDPKAVATAQAQAQEHELPATFVSGDVQAELPGGNFELVFLSFILAHTNKPAQVISHAYARLNSGGLLWSMEADDNLSAATDPTWQKLGGLMIRAMDSLGVHPHIVSELPTLLAEAGFVEIRHRESKQDNPYTTHSEAEQMSIFAALLGVMYNARQLIAAKTAIPLPEIENMIIELMNKGKNSLNLASAPVAVITARKP